MSDFVIGGNDIDVSIDDDIFERIEDDFFRNRPPGALDIGRVHKKEENFAILEYAVLALFYF